MADKEKRERKVTPVGEAKWAHLQKPKPPYEGKGDPKYQIDVFFDPANQEWKQWVEKVKTTLQTLPQQVNKKTGETVPKQSPIKKEFDSNDNPTGRLYVTFKTSDKFKPQVYDKFGQPYPDGTLVGNGSKVRVSYIENSFEAFGGGINFYLNAVQVLELVEYAAQTAKGYGFDVEEPPECSELEPF